MTATPRYVYLRYAADNRLASVGVATDQAAVPDPSTAYPRVNIETWDSSFETLVRLVQLVRALSQPTPSPPETSSCSAPADKKEGEGFIASGH